MIQKNNMEQYTEQLPEEVAVPISTTNETSDSSKSTCERLTCVRRGANRKYSCCFKVSAWTVGILLATAVAYFFVWLFVLRIGPSYKQGESFDMLVSAGAAHTDVVFNATEFRFDTDAENSCNTGLWRGKLTIIRQPEQDYCRATIYIPGPSKVAKFEATSGGTLNVLNYPGGGVKAYSNSGGGLSLKGGEVTKLTGKAMTGGSISLQDGIKIGCYNVKETRGGRFETNGFGSQC